MYKGSGPRIVPLLVGILIIALIIAAVVSLGRMLLVGNGDSNNEAPQDSASSVRAAVLDMGGNRSVSLIVRGPIVADEEYRSYQIVISPTKRTYTTYSGYLDQVLDQKTYDNNDRAYEEFVYALDKANISSINKGAQDDDIRGVCATDGLAFKFDTRDGGATDHTLWTSTCSKSKGTMNAKIGQIHALFANQVADYKPLFGEIY